MLLKKKTIFYAGSFSVGLGGCYTCICDWNRNGCIRSAFLVFYYPCILEIIQKFGYKMPNGKNRKIND